MRKLLIVALMLFCFLGKAFADEGMWLLPLLEKMNIKEMKAKGFKLSAKDIYDINGSAIKDAIVIFGGGCTGEIVSAEGLLLTNHHCGYGTIQQHSSVENDYLKNGFWAMNRGQEIPSPGLSVTFVRRIEDVSEKILPYLSDTMSEDTRYATVARLSKEITAAAIPEGSSERAAVRDFFGGNQYIMFVTERYEDVRLVGAPPSSIGKFGGETDNWMWPRHTGDFSMFRVYSDANGQPAKYTKDNVPYKAPQHLTISLKGIKPGDFTMILGFPGSTERYKTSYEIDYTLNIDNPNRIFIRGERQQLIKEDMLASDKVRIQYASKYASSSNYWKNSIGMSRGLKKLNVRQQKADLEQRLTEWINADPARQAKYGEAMPLIKAYVDEMTTVGGARQYLMEAIISGTELVVASRQLNSLIDNKNNTIDTSRIKSVQTAFADFYKDYNPSTDRKIAKKMFAIVRDSVDKASLPSSFELIETGFRGDVNAYIDYVYDNSIIANEESFAEFMRNPSFDAIQNDPAYKMANAVVKVYIGFAPTLAAAKEKFIRGHRLFIAALMEMQPEKKFYPDANFTMRMTYGQVLPYDPQDAVTYHHYTTLSGVMAKEDPENAFEFTVPEKLKDLYKKRDFGRYAYKGDIPVAFLSNNDITGGNSGSPVLNGKGELLGLAFDGNWEAMSGDIAFEPELQRTISVDIRYVLFLIDKFAGASHLIDEMTIVE